MHEMWSSNSDGDSDGDDMTVMVLLTSRDIMQSKSYEKTMLSRKSVKQPYHPTQEVIQMMEIFRKMVNECVRLGIEHNKTSMKSLSNLCYPQLKKYKIVTQYKLCAISKASGILRNYRKTLKKKHDTKKPYCTRPMLITCYGLSVKKHTLHMPHKLRIRLNQYTLKVLSNPDLKARSVTITLDSTSISFAKKTDLIECTGMLGLDRNLNNVTMLDTDGNVKQYDMRMATEIKAHCKQVKSQFTRNDVSVGKLIYGKYGNIEKNRVQWILHNVSKRIVTHAKKNRMVIAMENINGIRRLYRRGNGQGASYRGKMNSWSYYELQRQIEYKASWEGIPIIYVHARNTSAKCSKCGCNMKPEESRMLRCASCMMSIDRDVNASRNILARGLEQLRMAPNAQQVQWFKPVGGAGEAMVAVQRCAVDAPQLSSGGGK